MGVTQLTLQYTSHLKELISVPKKSESMSLMQEPFGKTIESIDHSEELLLNAQRREVLADLMDTQFDSDQQKGHQFG